MNVENLLLVLMPKLIKTLSILVKEEAESKV